MTRPSARTLNYALYQAGWFACILGPAWGYPFAGTAIALGLIGVHLALARRRRDEVVLMLWAALIGTVADSAQIALGTLGFRSGVVVAWLPPPWLVVLWMQFATTFQYAMAWMQGRPLAAALFGAVGGPLAFWAGWRMGVVELHPQHWLSYLTLAVVWSIALPLLAGLAARQHGGAGAGEYRQRGPISAAPTPDGRRRV
ncbi:MAG: DUF2878 domain-containing protein [Candidatus Binatia bacterium]